MRRSRNLPKVMKFVSNGSKIQNKSGLFLVTSPYCFHMSCYRCFINSFILLQIHSNCLSFDKYYVYGVN